MKPYFYIKSRRMRWAGHVARMREMQKSYIILVGKPGRKSPLGRSGHKSEDILGRILGKLGWKLWTELVWLRIGTSGAV